MFKQNLATMIREFSSHSSAQLKSDALAILEKVQERAYEGFPQFRADLGVYLALLEETYISHESNSVLADIWHQSKTLLHNEYWGKFLFSPDEDLIHFHIDRD